MVLKTVKQEAGEELDWWGGLPGVWDAAVSTRLRRGSCTRPGAEAPERRAVGAIAQAPGNSAEGSWDRVGGAWQRYGEVEGKPRAQILQDLQP